MPESQLIRRLQLIGNSFTATIPRPFIHALKWHPGDYLMLTLKDGHVVIHALQSHQVPMEANRTGHGATAPGENEGGR